MYITLEEINLEIRSSKNLQSILFLQSIFFLVLYIYYHYRKKNKNTLNICVSRRRKKKKKNCSHSQKGTLSTLFVNHFNVYLNPF